jgi:uncharacterized protein YjaZ
MAEALNQHPSSELQKTILERVEQYYSEVKGIIDGLPDDVKIYFDQTVVIPGYASGGFAYDPSTITIGFDEHFQEGDVWADLRATIFHEAFHLAQKFTFFDSQGNEVPMQLPIDNAIYEGAATVFERDFAGRTPGWAKYLDDVTMNEWTKEIMGLDTNYDWEKWKFYDPDTDRQWILYKVGVYIVDKALEKSSLSIVDLQHKDPQEILKIASLPL